MFRNIVRAHARSLILVVILCFCVALMLLTNYFVNRVEPAPSAREQSMQNVVLTLKDGTTLDMEKLGEHPVVVVSWATWCPDCLPVLASASAVKTHFGDALHVIAVNRKEDEQIVRDFRAQFTLPENITYTRDGADAFYGQSGGQGMPEVVVYDREGNTAAHFLSVPTADELITLIMPLVNR